MSTLALLIEGCIISAILVTFTALGWNQLGAADALGLTHVGWWPIFGGLTALNSTAFVVGSGFHSGRIRAKHINEQVNA